MATNFVDMNNFVIDHILRGIATAKGASNELGLADGDIMFSIDQITNPSLSCSSESTDAVDALNVPVATFYRAKTCEFSAENALFDMRLLATQSGTVKKIAGRPFGTAGQAGYVSNVSVTVPAFEEVEITSTHAYTLKHVPAIGSVVKVYVMNEDGTLGNKLIKETSTSIGSGNERTHYVYTENKESDVVTSITVSYTYDANGTAGFSEKERLFVMYEYVAAQDKAVEITNSAQNFPTACKFTMEILGADICNPTDKIYAYLVFPNCKLSPDFDWSIATDSTHPFSMKAMQDYCKKDKPLFSIVIPDDND